MSALVPLPTRIGDDPQGFVSAVNDRLRRISQLLGGGATAGPAGPAGPPGTSGGGSADNEWQIPLIVVTRTLAAAIATDVVTTCTLDAGTSLPATRFLMTLASGECVRVTARTGPNVTAMDRGWNGTVAAAQAFGSAAVVILATPNLSNGAAQMIAATGNITQLDPVGVPGPMAWSMDIVQDATGNWSVLPSGNYLGCGDNSNGDPRRWDISPSMRYVVQWRTQGDGATIPMGGNGGPYSLT